MDLDKLRLSKNALYLVAGVVLILGVFGVLFAAVGKKPVNQKTRLKLTEVVIENETAKLKIKRNGVAEISSGNRVFFQYWDQNRVNELFALLEKADLSKFGSRLKPGELGYLLTLTTAGGVITVAIPADSDFIPNGVVQLIAALSQITSQDDSESGGAAAYLPSPSPLGPALASPTASPIAAPSPSPSPASSPPALVTPGPSSPVQPTPTPSGGGGGGGGGGQQQLFVCQYTGATGDFQILSETMCDR